MASTKTKTSKSKAAAVGSLWDLKADVASVSETITRNKAAGVNATVGSRRPDKVRNPGVICLAAANWASIETYDLGTH